MSSTVVCGYSDANWEINSSRENPCQVYAELQGKCDSSFIIRSVTTSSPPYTPPNNACGCNIIAYNLMGGCGWCQTGILSGWWLTLDQWIGNCTAAQFNPSTIPPTVSTAGIDIPEWAFAIPSGTSWSPSQASFAAISATPSLSTASTATATGTSGFTFSTARPITTSDSGSGIVSLNAALGAGATVGIVFGVVLGLWALSLVVMVFVYFRRQSQRQAWYGPMAAFYQGQKSGYGGYGGYGGQNPPGAGVPLLYPTGPSPSNATNITGGAYRPPPAESSGLYPGGAPPAGYNAGYVPPPPESNYHGSQSLQGGATSSGGHVGPGGWAGGPPANTPSVYSGSTTTAPYVPNTASVYGSQTALAVAPGAPGVPPAPGAQGYRGHAEVY